MLLPTHPKQALPQKIFAFLRIFIFFFSFSLILLTNSSLKSVKAVFFLIEKRLHRLLLYAFLPYTASVSSCVWALKRTLSSRWFFGVPKIHALAQKRKNARKFIFEVSKTSQFSYSDKRES